MQTNSTEKKYESVISLGYFCNVSMELERVGLRFASYPFDWVISSDFGKVISLIKNKFEGFMLYENLLQEYKINPKYYYDKENDIHFYHDFSSNKALLSQYDKAFSKYQRRTKRLTEQLQRPTLLIRYILDKSELNYINEHCEEINAVIKEYNPDNDIIYVTDTELTSEKIKLFFAKKENGRTVSAKMLDACPELLEYILSHTIIEEKQLAENKKIAKKSIARRKMNAVKRKALSVVLKLLPFLKRKPYRHDRQYEE